MHVLQRNRIPAVRVILVASKQTYKDLVRIFRRKEIYRDMLSFVRQFVVMHNTDNFDGMKEVLEWKIGEYDTMCSMMSNNVFNDVTRTTNNATNIGRK